VLQLGAFGGRDKQRLPFQRPSVLFPRLIPGDMGVVTAADIFPDPRLVSAIAANIGSSLVVVLRGVICCPHMCSKLGDRGEQSRACDHHEEGAAEADRAA
jgi:hypothetical protein